jgi:ribosomal-protein-alanine N-acetyltransferase
MKESNNFCSIDRNIIGRRVILVRPHLDFIDEFLAAVESSKSLHTPWVKPPSTKSEFIAYLQNTVRPSRESFWVRSTLDSSLVGVIEVRSILPSVDDSGTISYFAFNPWSGCGLLREALTHFITFIFKSRKLRRLIADIEAENTKSLGLVFRLGFQQDGDVTKLLTDGSFRNYQKWVIYADDWFKRIVS